MTLQLHRLLMQDKLERLFKEAGEEEVLTLEMSAEQMPELLAIRETEPQANWPIALLNSDLMMVLLNRIDWEREVIMTPLIPRELQEEVQQQTLQGLLETL